MRRRRRQSRARPRSPGASIFGGVVGAGFGLFWTIMAIAITAEAPFPIVRIIFPMFGILFIVVSIAGAVSNYRRTLPFDPGAAEDPAPSNKQPHCRQCGLPLRQAANFCPNCGQKALA